jgi:predicted lipoprotein
MPLTNTNQTTLSVGHLHKEKGYRSASASFTQTLRGAEPRGLGQAPEVNRSNNILLFPEKEAKSVVLLRRSSQVVQTLREAESRGLGLAPEVNRSNRILLFPEKEAKSVCSASQNSTGYPNPPRSGATGSGAGPRSQLI